MSRPERALPPRSTEPGQEPIVECYTFAAPRPKGHYSQAISHGGLIYVSGQLPIHTETDEPELGPIEAQAELVLRNLAAILESQGSGLSRVLMITVYVSDIALWERVDAVYARVFGDHRPARAVVPTGELHYGVQIEVQAVAAG